MRPVRFILLLACFVALPVFLTCWSLFSSHENRGDTFRAGYAPQTSRLKALFSFSTPSSLFPPSAVISIRNDNSSFFLARPAAFGPSLPSDGLTGELWVGRGFGDETAFEEDGVHITGWELGCSDVPGWREDERKRAEKVATLDKPQKRSIDTLRTDGDGEVSADKLDSDAATASDDGTDDYLHHPLSDSNPARPGKPGEPANVDSSDKNKKPIHADIESLQEGADIAGKVVLLARGGCGFLEKVKWVQRRGGIALIVGDRERGASLTIMYAKGDTSNVTLPSIFTSWNAAHLLSSLVPPRGLVVEDGRAGGELKKANAQADKPIFTTTSSKVKPTNSPHRKGSKEEDDANGWMQDALAAIGLADNSPWHQEDSRRPPGSGNIEWVMLEDWDEEAQAKADPKTQSQTTSRVLTTSTTSSKARIPTFRRADDFVIGVQDWRDTELIAPKSSSTSPQNGGNNGKFSGSASSVKLPKPTETSLKGGSITPGSGEYDHQKLDQIRQPKDKASNDRTKQSGQTAEKSIDEPSSGFFSFFNDAEEATVQPPQSESNIPPKKPSQKKLKDEDQEGLWVTLTPTSVSTSPFFDTLLVLVVSPLVTLTVVYALLLLRSRIRRRRWRAPKSVVERLPVRTYHTMSTSSSTTSSQVSTPEHSSVTSPLLHPTTQAPPIRTRPRSQTTSGVIEGSLSSSQSMRSLSRSPQSEKLKARSIKRKRYTGRQLECVVCLEEYVDGESRVMSLPCGHEFHADCITPWLVNRRRTCPICKGDVVRSMTRAGRGSSSDQRQQGEETSDDIQSRAAQTVNEEPTAAIPIPSRVDEDEDDDIEQGQDVEEPLLDRAEREQQSAWRNVIARSLSRLSGDTVWRSQTPENRSR